MARGVGSTTGALNALRALITENAFTTNTVTCYIVLLGKEPLLTYFFASIARIVRSRSPASPVRASRCYRAKDETQGLGNRKDSKPKQLLKDR